MHGVKLVVDALSCSSRRAFFGLEGGDGDFVLIEVGFEGREGRIARLSPPVALFSLGFGAGFASSRLS